MFRFWFLTNFFPALNEQLLCVCMLMCIHAVWKLELKIEIVNRLHCFDVYDDDIYQLL